MAIFTQVLIMPTINIIGGSYEMEAVSFDAQRCVNMYPLISESGTSKSPAALRSVAGLLEFSTIGGGGIRGGIESAGRAFFISGDEFYEVLNDGTSTKRGDMASATSYCQLSENPTQVMIIDGEGNGYIFNKTTNVFAQITDEDFPVASSLTFQDGYFIVSEANSAKFYISNINDGLTWDTLDFTTVEGSPDNLVAVVSDKSNLWAFGTKSVEVYQNSGSSLFPFAKLAGAYIETGCDSANTIKIVNNTLVWLGSDENGNAIVWRLDGYNAVRVSTQSIERKISEGSNLEESYAWVYHERGHVFYMLQIKGLNTTLCLDLATNIWHERVFRDPLTGEDRQHRGSCHVFAFEKHLVGDRETNQVFDMSLNYYSDNGNPLVKKRITPHLSEERRLITHAQLELDMEIGVGLQSGQGSDPQIMMRYSDDGGRTYSSELWRTIGKVGNYKTRVRWNRLGSSRDRVYSFEISDPVFVQINAAYLNNT
jgi:ribosomal protein S11